MYPETNIGLLLHHMEAKEEWEPYRMNDDQHDLSSVLLRKQFRLTHKLLNALFNHFFRRRPTRTTRRYQRQIARGWISLLLSGLVYFGTAYSENNIANSAKKKIILKYDSKYNIWQEDHGINHCEAFPLFLGNVRLGGI